MPLRSRLLLFVTFTTLILAALVAWGFQADSIPPDTLQSTSAVDVTYPPDAIRFRPRAPKSATGILFLPDSFVDPEAYTPLLKSLSTAGHHSVLQALPLRCACVEPQVNSLFSRIHQFIAANPQTRWFIGGHGRGGLLAARFARESPAQIAGLVLLATAHPQDFDISTLPIPVTKIFGRNDLISTPAEIRAYAKLLPRATSLVEIPGGNHAQFAYYRFHPFDGEASISRDAQQTALLKAVRAALAR